MKNVRKSLILVLILSIFMSAIPFITNRSYAEEATRTSIVSGKDASKYVFNAKDTLVWASDVGANTVEKSLWPFTATHITQEKIDSKDFVELNESAEYGDNELIASDASNLQSAMFNGDDSFKIVPSLSKALSIDENDITLKIKIRMPAINKEYTYERKNGKLVQSKEDVKNNLKSLFEYSKHCFTSGEYKDLDSDYKLENGTEKDWDDYIDAIITNKQKGDETVVVNDEDIWHQAVEENDYATISIDAILPDETTYKLVIGENDKWVRNWLLEKVEASKPVADFNTTIEYDCKTDDNTKGKMSDDGKIYLPPYYDNDNNKKDADAVATIKSTTDETIVKTNGVALTDSNVKGNPNSEGWYYPDINNKKVIAKDYPFDNYDNTTYNGIVSEKVDLTGGEGGKSSQEPSIKWTFRRKIKEQVEKDDGTTVVTITYNLPVEESSIELGWSPIYDNDGKTIHKITRTFKKGEKYDKDVTVKQNGTGVPNTTHVTVKPKVLPATGQSTTLIFVILFIAVIAITRYFKDKNNVIK